MYKVTVTGKATVKNINLKCPNESCGYEEERLISMVGFDEEADAIVASGIICPSCEAELQKVFTLQSQMGRPAFAGKVKDEAKENADMKQSFHERFIKSGEMDQCRHKHGKLFDQSLVSAAAKRIKATEA